MRTRTFSFQLILSAAVVVFLATAAYCQQTEYSENQRLNMESHVGGMTGHATTGQPTYKRFCIGCHGSLGDGQGENAQWIDPKPRNFTIAIFRCRSTPTGTLPTDTDLYDTIGRGMLNSNMPHWLPLTNQDRVDLVAYVKHFSPRWLTEQPGTPIVIPPEPAVTAERIKEGRVVFQRLECWKCHGVTGQGNGPSADTLVDDENRPIKPFNFHDEQKFKCGSTDQAMYKDFMTGLDGSPMPSFSDNLKPEEAWSLVFYLRTLQPDNTPEKQIAKQLGLTPINPLEPLPSSDSGQQAPSSDQGTNPASQPAPAQPNNNSPAPTQPASPATPPSTTPPPSNNSGNE
jgi:mono/diheme cytochrome c family protein